MKATLFCNLPYAFSMLKPLAEELEKRNIEYIWYIPKEIVSLFDEGDANITSDIKEISVFKPDMIFVPGNEVPYSLTGVKVQIFHGLAGEKKDHFRIREYFDLYLTQGPHFTDRFNSLQKKHQNFKVVECGWPKLDNLFKKDLVLQEQKKILLLKAKASHIVLFAPTFSKSLTSAPILKDELKKLSDDPRYLVIIKFHDKMDKGVKSEYEKMVSAKLVILDDDDITRSLKLADIMVSDTSSVVYEFQLLNKPVITLNNCSNDISWLDIKDKKLLIDSVNKTLFEEDTFKKMRENIIASYHPYKDGKSAYRMVEATLEFISKHGVPTKRKVSLFRKYKIIKKYGFI